MSSLAHAFTSPSLDRSLRAHSHAIQATAFILTSGITPLDAAGQLVGRDIVGQTRRVMLNVCQLRRDMGSARGRAVQASVYLDDSDRDFSDFDPAASA